MLGRRVLAYFPSILFYFLKEKDPRTLRPSIFYYIKSLSRVLLEDVYLTDVYLMCT
jgi:hypothetical protein